MPVRLNAKCRNSFSNDFFCVWYSIVYIKKSGKIILSLFTYSVCNEKVQRIGWLTFRRNVRSSELYIYIHGLYRYILYGWEWASCKNRNSLTRYQRYIEKLVILTPRLPFCVEYLRTRSTPSHACAGFVHAPPLSDIVT